MKEIVFFDSGVGGLTVLYEAIKILPNEKYLYYADTDNVPYGLKEKEDIKRLVFEAVANLDVENIKALVLACNTATSVAVQDLREKYKFPIVGMEPAVKPAKDLGRKKILVCATESTLKQNKLKELIKNLNIEDRIEMMSLQDLVGFAEDYNFHDEQLEKYLKRKIDGINWNEYNAIVLGCTHFLFFKKQIREYIPDHIKLIDGNAGTVRQLSSLIDKNQNDKTLNVNFVRSGRPCFYYEFDHYLRYYDELQY